MAVSLEAFEAIANGKYNVGEIRLSEDGNRLEKVNNHVWFTKKNNVALTAAQNRATRTALLDALTRDGLAPETVALYRNVLLGEGRATQSLSRDYVRYLLGMPLVTEREARDRPLSYTTPQVLVMEKRLGERNITMKNDRTLRVKSKKDVAYTQDVNDELNAAFRKVHEAQLQIGDLGEDYNNFGAPAAVVFRGVLLALRMDNRLSPRQHGEAESVFSEQGIHNATDVLFWSYRDDVQQNRDGGRRAVQNARQNLRDVLADMLNQVLGPVVDEAILNDYLARIEID